MRPDHETRLLRSFVKRLTSFVDQFSSTDRKFDAIKLQVDAIAENTQATKKNTEPNRQRPVTVNTEFKLPPAVTDYYSAKANKNPRKRVPEWLTFVVSVLTLLVVAIYTCMTYKQWQASIDGNAISRNNLVISQRAYLAGGKVEIELYGISISVVNVGHVPATLTAVNFTYGRARIDKKGAVVLDSKVVQSNTLRSAIMPAPVTNFGMVVTLPILSETDQAEVDSGVQQMVVDGTITYEAGFNNADQMPIVDVLRVHTGYNAKTKSWTHVEEGLPINFREPPANRQQQ
jgi:hypothetical protein